MTKVRILAAVAAAFLGTPALAQDPAPSPTAAPPAAAPLLTPAVSVVSAAEREMVERVVVTGTLVPREEILVAAEVDGLRIVELAADEGDRVKQGQVLARLSKDVIEAQLTQNTAQIARADAAIAQARSNIAQAEASQTEAEQALERAQTLAKTGNTPAAVLEQRQAGARTAAAALAAARSGLAIAEAERRSAQAQRQELEVRLNRAEIKAPTAGIVNRRNARVGATASAAGEPLFRIIRDGEIELEGEVVETQLPRIREGAPASVSFGDHTITGRVRNVLPEVDRATRLGKVRISLDKDAALRIGSFARGTIELTRRNGVAVPLSAVLYGPDGATVQVVKNDRIDTRKVITGLSDSGFMEIREGVAANELVVARAGSFLREGDPVRPVLPKAEASRQGAPAGAASAAPAAADGTKGAADPVTQTGAAERTAQREGAR